MKKLKKEKLQRIERFKQKELEVQAMEQEQVQEVLRKRQEEEQRRQQQMEERRELIKGNLLRMEKERQRRLTQWHQAQSHKVIPMQKALRLIQSGKALTEAEGMGNYQKYKGQQLALVEQQSEGKLPLYIEMETKFKHKIES